VLKVSNKVPLKENVDEALISCPDVKNVIVSRRSKDSMMVRGRDLNMDDAMTRQRPWCPPEGLICSCFMQNLKTRGKKDLTASTICLFCKRVCRRCFVSV
jgi:hypothetical protein